MLPVAAWGWKNFRPKFNWHSQRRCHRFGRADVVQAKVTLYSDQTGVKREAKTNEDGRFIFTNVLTGAYAVRVEAPGFKKAEQHDIVVQVNQIVALSYALSVGNVEESVEVTAGAEALQTASSSLGTVIDTVAANDLPLNGHNFTQILTLTPGVTPVQNEQGANSGTGYQQDVSIPGSPTFRPNVNGQWNRSNLYFLDGIWNTTNIASGYAVMPVIDAVQEFKVQSHNDDAEYGGSMGGVINLVSKSGSARLHRFGLGRCAQQLLRRQGTPSPTPVSPAPAPTTRTNSAPRWAAPSSFPRSTTDGRRLSSSSPMTVGAITRQARTSTMSRPPTS